MRLNELASDNDLKQFVEIIRTDCSDFIKTGHYLYRGMTGKPPHGKFKIRQNRKPRDSSKFGTSYLNHLFDKKTGGEIKNVRGSVAHVISSITLTEFYGSPYLVFPVNGTVYSYMVGVADTFDMADIWDQVLSDSYEETGGLRHTDDYDMFLKLPKDVQNELNKKFKAIQKRRGLPLKPTITKNPRKLKRAVKEGWEIGLHGSFYYAIEVKNLSDWFYEEVFK